MPRKKSTQTVPTNSQGITWEDWYQATGLESLVETSDKVDKKSVLALLKQSWELCEDPKDYRLK